jgi:hypothetical protein
MTRRQLRAHKNLCADVIKDDFDLTNNKFSYKPLKELGPKVPDCFGDFGQTFQFLPEAAHREAALSL